MEIIYSDGASKLDSITCFYGDVLDLSLLNIKYKGIVYEDQHKVKTFLNIIKNRKRIESIFEYLELDKDILNKKIDDLCNTDFKFVLLAYTLLTNRKVIIFDNIEIGLINRDQKKLIKVIRELAKDKKIIVVSKNLTFLSQISSNITFVEEGNVIKLNTYEELINDYNISDEPDIVKFINMANKKGANLSFTLNSKELLKDIFRSVN